MTISCQSLQNKTEDSFHNNTYVQARQITAGPDFELTDHISFNDTIRVFRTFSQGLCLRILESVCSIGLCTIRHRLDVTPHLPLAASLWGCSPDSPIPDSEPTR